MPNRTSFRVFACVALLLMSGRAYAASITYDSATSPAVVNIGPTPTNFGPLNWAFPEFDSLLGTLQSVRLNVGLSGTTTIDVQATQSATDGLVSTRVTAFVQSATADLAGDAGGGIPLIEAFSDLFFFSLDDGESDTSGPMAFMGSSSELYTAPDVLAAFSSPGGGTELLIVWAMADTIFEFFGGNATGTQATLAAFAGSVTYEYDPFAEPDPPAPVPEPSSLMLLGSGALALAYGIRRKRS